MPKKKKEKNAIIILAVLALVVIIGLVLVASFIEAPSIGSHEVGVVPLFGTIMVDAPNTYSGRGIIGPNNVIDTLRQFSSREGMKAIVLNINTGGGSAMASERIGAELDRIRMQGIELHCVVEGAALSGGYWLAAKCDQIYVAKGSLVGSIGVTMAGFGFDEFIDEHNVSYRRFVSGKYKDFASPFRELMPEEEVMIQELLDIYYADFVQVVADGRGLSFDEARALADGKIYTGEQAIELGLADEIGYLETVIPKLEERFEARVLYADNSVSFLEQILAFSPAQLYQQTVMHAITSPPHLQT